MKLINKITAIKNWIGKTVLWFMGLMIISGQNYALFLKGFLLTDKEVGVEISTYLVVNSFGLLLIVGGWRLNAFIDKFISTSKENE